MNFHNKASDDDKNVSLKDKLLQLFKKLQSDKKTLAIIMLGILGSLLIAFSSLGDNQEEKSADINPAAIADTDEAEHKLEELIESIDGVGRVQAMITYESGFENVFALDTDEKHSENDSSVKKEHILTEDETGLLLKTVYPQVRGVAVVCSGGDDPVIREKIYSVISALFNISSNKISVTDMV